MDMSISKQDHDYYIRHAIKLSESAVEHGNEPFGACLVSKDGEILLSAENTIRMPNRDCTRHAELNLISMATQKFDRETLKDCTLYTSCEPCIMCSGTFLWSGIQRLVYAMASTTLGVSLVNIIGDNDRCFFL